MAAIRWDISSYDKVRAALLALAAQGLGVDFDSAAIQSYGYQCWDVAANFWWNAGRETFRTKTSFTGQGGTDSYVQTAILYAPAKQWNEASPFYFVNNWREVKRGMMCVWRGGGCNGLIGVTGHNAFADQDVTSSTGNIRCLGQNQTGQQVAIGGYPPTINDYFNSDGFLGAFAYAPWFGSTPPDPPDPPDPPIPPTPPVGTILHPNGNNIVILKRGLQLRNIKV